MIPSPESGRGLAGDEFVRSTGVTGAGSERRVGATDAVRDTDRRVRGNVCDSVDIATGDVGRESEIWVLETQASIPPALSPGDGLKSTSIPRPVPNESRFASSRGVDGLWELGLFR